MPYSINTRFIDFLDFLEILVIELGLGLGLELGFLESLVDAPSSSSSILIDSIRLYNSTRSIILVLVPSILSVSVSVDSDQSKESAIQLPALVRPLSRPVQNTPKVHQFRHGDKIENRYKREDCTPADLRELFLEAEGVEKFLLGEFPSDGKSGNFNFSS